MYMLLCQETNPSYLYKSNQILVSQMQTESVFVSILSLRKPDIFISFNFGYI